MAELLKPKQIARALEISESSVKRWCDQGKIATQYTAGGHRRVAICDLLEFLRRSPGRRLVHPEVLQMPASERALRDCDQARRSLVDALLRGDAGQTRQILLDAYLAGRTVAQIGDDWIGRAFREIGCRWECGEAEVYQERRACEIMTACLSELRTLIPPPVQGASRAIGGTPSGDQYVLGTTLAELVLRENGWNATSLGCNLPYDTLAAALRDEQPQVFWLSCSHLVNEHAFLGGYRQLYQHFGARTAFVLGGLALTDSLRQQIRYAAFGDTLGHLDSFASTLRRVRNSGSSSAWSE